jgi:hypothetical protein
MPLARNPERAARFADTGKCLFADAGRVFLTRARRRVVAAPHPAGEVQRESVGRRRHPPTSRGGGVTARSAGRLHRHHRRYRTGAHGPYPCRLLIGDASVIAAGLAPPECLGKDRDAYEDGDDAEKQGHTVARRASERDDHVATVTCPPPAAVLARASSPRGFAGRAD